MIDGENGGDDSVDPTCVGGEKVKDQYMDEAHGMSTPHPVRPKRDRQNDIKYFVFFGATKLCTMIKHVLTIFAPSKLSDPTNSFGARDSHLRPVHCAKFHVERILLHVHLSYVY